MRPMLDRIRVTLREVLARQKDEMGFNLSALQYIGNQVRESSSKDYVDEETWDEQQAQKLNSRKKRAFVSVA